MFKKISSKEFWISPYTLAILGIILLFVINNSVVTFAILGFIFGIISKKLIDFKTILKFALTISFVQLFISLIFIFINEFDYLLFAPGVYLKRILVYFAMSLIIGSIIFFVVNSIVYGIYLLIKKLKSHKEEI